MGMVPEKMKDAMSAPTVNMIYTAGMTFTIRWEIAFSISAHFIPKDMAIKAVNAAVHSSIICSSSLNTP